MKFLRTLFVLLLCAVLPLTGLAASGMAGQCPMQAAMAGSGSTASESMPGCESMAAPASPHNKSKGTLCKVTAQCQMGSLYHPVSTPQVARPSDAFRPVLFHYIQALFVREPDGLWKPPRAL
jgi:hypothetical protein